MTTTERPLSVTSRVAWQGFQDRVAALGGRVLEPRWLGKGVPHRVICKDGHECSPTPTNVQRGQGICGPCALAYRGQDKRSVAAEQLFRARLAECGARLLETHYLGSREPHRVICKNGHTVSPTPTNVNRGQGICRACAGTGLPEVAEARFRELLKAQGATLLEQRWLGNQVGHRALCAKGHLCHPLPSNISQGVGICAKCAGKIWDVFYIVAHPRLQRVKFGITSGDPRRRLMDHRALGYSSVVRIVSQLEMALNLERRVRVTLDAAGLKPVQGREYYDISALPVVLDVADHWEEPGAQNGQNGAVTNGAGDPAVVERALAAARNGSIPDV